MKTYTEDTMLMPLRSLQLLSTPLSVHFMFREQTVLLTGYFLSKFCFKCGQNLNTSIATKCWNHHPLMNYSEGSSSAFLLFLSLVPYALSTTPKSWYVLPDTLQ